MKTLSFPALAAIALAGIVNAVAAEPETPDSAAMPFDHGAAIDLSRILNAPPGPVPADAPKRPLAKYELPDQIYHGVLINTDTAPHFKAAGVPVRPVFWDTYKRYVEVAGSKPSMIGTSDPLWLDGHKAPRDSLYLRLETIDSIPDVMPFVKHYMGDWKPGGPFLSADEILAGQHDDEFVNLAENAKRFGKPFILSFNHEMNGNWFFFSPGYKYGTDWTPEKFVRIWRRAVDIFRREGVTNVAFAFCPQTNGVQIGDYPPAESFKPFYPGDDYVDWVGASLYNDKNPFQMDALAEAYPNKPIILAEWGVYEHRRAWYKPQPYPGDAGWMQAMFDVLTTRYPNMKAFTYFEWNDDGALERDPGQVEVYRTEIAKPPFKNND